MTPEERAKAIRKEHCAHIGCRISPAIATAIREAVAAEREACAKICDDIRHENYSSETDDWVAGTAACATAIRSRSNEGGEG